MHHLAKAESEEFSEFYGEEDVECEFCAEEEHNIVFADFGGEDVFCGFGVLPIWDGVIEQSVESLRFEDSSGEIVVAEVCGFIDDAEVELGVVGL